MKRCCSLIVALLFVVSTADGLAEERSTSAPASFDALATAVVKQLLGDRGYKIGSGKVSPFILGQVIGDDDGQHPTSVQIIELKCGTMKVLNIYGKDHDDGELYAGICDRSSELTPELLAAANQARLRTIAAIMKVTVRTDASAFAGLGPQQGTLGSGLSSQYLSVVYVGHGLAIIPTLILDLNDGKRAVVLQLLIDNCNHRPPLCNSQKELLQDIAFRIAQGIP
jgi:hypothetical protein